MSEINDPLICSQWFTCSSKIVYKIPSNSLFTVASSYNENILNQHLKCFSNRRSFYSIWLRFRSNNTTVGSTLYILHLLLDRINWSFLNISRRRFDRRKDSGSLDNEWIAGRICNWLVFKLRQDGRLRANNINLNSLAYSSDSDKKLILKSIRE